MLGTPSAHVRIPVQGALGWDHAAESIGSGISSVIIGSAALAQEKDEVNAAGDLAAFSGRLQTLGNEIRSGMSGTDTADWEFRWRELSEPLLAEAVAELPPSVREVGRKLAADYSRRASVQALRDREVDRLEESRRNWQQQVETAVQAGDAAQAEQWLRQGTGVFVPEEHLEEEVSRACSRACRVGWQKALLQNPLQAMADFGAVPESEAPRDAHERSLLQTEMLAARRSARRRLADELVLNLQEEQAFDEHQLQLAQRAGVLSAQQLVSAGAAPTQPGAGELCAWLRRIDEAPADADARAMLQLDIATAAMPVSERLRLLERLKSGEGVAPSERLSFSRALWRMYTSGQLGCPGDEAALRRLNELQQTGFPVLTEQGTESAARWLEQLQGKGEHWVCFVTHN